MNKNCLHCGKVFNKTKTKSLKVWKDTVKYCSRECVGHATGKDRIITLNKSRTGIPLPESQRAKMRLKRVGRKPMLGKKHSEEVRQKIKEATLKAQTPAVRLAKSLSHRGEKNYNWKGGRTGLKHQMRSGFKYRQWRSDVFTRDNFTCTWCGDDRGGNLEADHIEELHKIFDTYNIKSLEEADICEALWNINNGRTLCKDCHINRHKLTL